jgi:branched-chain amino acid aminotransferase
MLIYVNGSWVQEAEAVIPFKDQGFLYGDSLFETIRINRGNPFRLQKHLDRMLNGMRTIYMDGHLLLESIPDLLIEIIQKNTLNNALVRVMITRGVTQDSSQETDSSLAIYISARKLSTFTEWPVKVIFVEEKNYPLLRFYPAIKSGNYLGNMLAKKDAEKAGAFEPVFVNNDGYVTECAIRNIFFIKGNTLLTPHVELGVLPGVIRDTIMELARKRGLQVEESFTLVKDVNDMDEAFISSTGVGVLPVTWDGFQSTYEQSQILRTDLQTLFNSGAQDVT